MDRRISFIKKISTIFFVIIISGCTIIRNISENISGNYLDGLKKNSSAISKTQVFDYKIDDCFIKVLNIFETGKISSKILKVDIHNYSILAMVSGGPMLDEADSIFDANSADVGIFLSEESSSKTKVDIRSFSSLFTERTAKMLFQELQNDLSLQ